jgi:hypothetical protein
VTHEETESLDSSKIIKEIQLVKIFPQNKYEVIGTLITLI